MPQSIQQLGQWRMCMRVYRMLVALMLIGWLYGCASLQVDVDVYKGPLANDRDVQLRQYAYLAVSHRPVMDRLLKALITARDACQARTAGDVSACDQQAALVDFLSETLELYNDVTTPNEVRRSIISSKSATKPDRYTGTLRRSTESATEDGIVTLTAKFSTALVESSSSPFDATKKQNLDKAVATLNEMMILLAQRLLIVVNNESQFAELGAVDDKEIKPLVAVLQSFGNSLLVQANDLQRQHNRSAKLTGNRQRDQAAIALAWNHPPPVAYDQIMRQISAERETLQKAAAQTDSAAASEAQRERLTAAMAAEREKLSQRQLALTNYLDQLKPIHAAYRTLVGEGMGIGEITQTDTASALADRRTIASLFPAAALAADQRTGAVILAPLFTWLTAEQAPSGTPLPDRVVRLLELEKYLSLEKAHLSAATASATSLAEGLKRIQDHVRNGLTLTRIELTTRREAVKVSVSAIDRLQATMGQLSQTARSAASANAADDNAARVLAVLGAIRKDVLRKADEAKLGQGIDVQILIKTTLTELEPDKPPYSLPRQDINLAKQAMQRIVIVPPFRCDGSVADTKMLQNAAQDCNRLEVIDALISSLSAQRIQALARGDNQSANSLLTAMDAAYEQRSTMIYLRPASDYLRSVYSASAFQADPVRNYRNMLDDWAKYLNPRDKFGTSKAQLENEKLYWQNVNKVTVAGGGFTNYVLAKDDVGNWYVKAYGSNPESIIQSATSLALFNTGKRINTDLLRRYELQRKIDASQSQADKTGLQTELEKLNTQDGRPLLSMRDRYAARYARDTFDQVIETHKLLVKVRLDARNRLIEPLKEHAECAAKLETELDSLDTSIHETPRARLEGLVNPAPKPELLTSEVEKYEKNIQQGLQAVLLYAVRSHSAIAAPSADECKAVADLPALAKAIQNAMRLSVSVIANQRKTDIARYADALTNIGEIASQSD